MPSRFLNEFDEPSHYSPSCPVAMTYYRVPLASSICYGSYNGCSALLHVAFALATRHKVFVPHAETRQEAGLSRGIPEVNPKSH
ncbi:hypothetical protein N7497_003782 [Penicillium chrysogenum]|nr:hypothetical protein N7497_003782 [Penicillium chrysogenum]